jgi:UDP-glucose 4-epimerase
VFDFARIVRDLTAGVPAGSDLARTIGAKGYHAEAFAEGPFPVEE